MSSTTSSSKTRPSSARKPASKRAAARTESATSVKTSVQIKAHVSPDELAVKLASSLKISTKPSKTAVKLEASARSSKERISSAMRTVNAASQGLTVLLQCPSKTEKQKAQDAEVLAATARTALIELRELSPGMLDTERAASSIVGKLLNLNLTTPAFGLLCDMHGPLTTLALVVPYSATMSIQLRDILRLEDALPLLHIAIPLASSFPLDDTLTTIVLTYLTHSLLICSNLVHTAPDASAFADALNSQHTLASWIPLCMHIPSEHTDILLTRAYTGLSKATGNPGLNPADALCVRRYALRCLLLTSPSTVDPGTFWDQAIKYANAFARATPSLWLGSGASVFPAEREAASLVVYTLTDLYDCAQTRSDVKLFCSGDAFFKFCEHWVSYARKGGDLSVLDRVAAIMIAIRVSPSKSSTTLETGPVPPSQDQESAHATPSAKAPSLSSRQDRLISLSQLCVPVIQATAFFEGLEAFTSSDQDIKTRAESVSTAMATLRRCLGKGEIASSEDNIHSEKKARRALERFRRILIRCLSTTLSAPRTTLVRSLLSDLVLSLESLLNGRATSDDYSAILDALFVLARTTLSPSDPRSIDAAYSFLGRAVSAIGLELSDSHEYCTAKQKPATVMAETYANFVRCISGAFYNLAGILYQADRFGYAVRFLRHGCILGRLALQLLDECELLAGANDAHVKQVDAWVQLQDQMARRWELLGVCYSKIGDRRLSYDALVQSIGSYKFDDASIETVQTLGSGEIFESSSNLKQLGAIIDRITYMGACELNCDADNVSLKRVVNDMPVADENQRLFIAGLLLERQIHSLESTLWKPSVQHITASLLRDTLHTYPAKTRPIRRAAMILRCLELLYYAGGAEDELLGILAYDWKQLVVDAETSLNSEDLGFDAGLARLRPYYKATVHLWLALYAHRRQDPQQPELAALHVQKVCSILQPLVVPTKPSSPVARRSRSPVVAKATRKGTTRALATRGVKSSARNVVPKTPRKPPVGRKHGMQVLDQQAPESVSEVIKISLVESRYYGFKHLFNLLRMAVDLMGFFAHVILKIQLLHITRRLCETQADDAHDEYIISSIDLAYEYLKLGKLKKAENIFNKTLVFLRTCRASEETRLLLSLRYTEALAALGDAKQSLVSYADAAALTKELVYNNKESSSTERMRARIERVERAALACSVFSRIKVTMDDPPAALDAMLQSLRLWNRALASVERVNTPTLAPTEPNPFDLSGSDKPSPEKPNGGGGNLVTSLPRQPMAAFKGLEWRIALGLLNTLLSLAALYFTRGSAREAEYFSEQAATLAGSMNAPAMLGWALTCKGDIQLRLGHLEQAYEALVKAAESLGNRESPELAEVHRLYADLHAKDMKDVDAQKLYREAAIMLEDVGKRLTAVDGVGVRRSSIGLANSVYANASDMLAPELLSSLLRRHIWLLRHDLGEEYQELLEKLSSLPASADMKAEENLLLAKLTLHDAYDHFRENIFLSSVTESVITLPMIVPGEKGLGSISTQNVSRLLSEADSLFWANLQAIAQRGKAFQVRETAIHIAHVRSLQTSVGKEGDNIPLLVANLLDASSAVTLHREMLEAIQNKFPELAAGDDLNWPAIEAKDSASSSRGKQRIRAPSPSPFAPPDISDEENTDTPSLAQFWNSIRDKYTSKAFSAEQLSQSRTETLPNHWTVIHISVTDDKNTMFVARQRSKHQPLVFSLPLKGRRESEDDEHLTFQDALEELKDIIRLNDETTRRAVTVKTQDRDARAGWWAERIALDKRLQELLENIEFCWLGAFKTILGEPTEVPPDVIADLRARLDKVFKRGLVSQDKKRKTQVRIEDALLERFSALSPKCRDEELEDLVYFVLDLYQLQGVHVAIAEVDIDQVVVDLRDALEEHTAMARARVLPVQDSHMFLVLDKNVQAIPWESIPILRGRSISRVPSLDFLLDRVDMARWRQGVSSDTAIDRCEVDARNAFYVLNPSGDLTATERRFAGWLEKMKSVGWEGITSKPPSEQQFANALSGKDLFIYFGHGGAEQFIRSHKVRHLPRCAATMLWGCSSGHLKDMGEFDCIGTPFNYMLGGCSSLIANLWDVTDRDIDKLSQAVFDELHLMPENITHQRTTPVSIVQALARSRDICKLKYLTGASPVIYGIPFYL